MAKTQLGIPVCLENGIDFSGREQLLIPEQVVETQGSEGFAGRRESVYTEIVNGAAEGAGLQQGTEEIESGTETDFEDSDGGGLSQGFADKGESRIDEDMFCLLPGAVDAVVACAKTFMQER